MRLKYRSGLSVLLAERGWKPVGQYSFTNEHEWNVISLIPTRTVQNEMAISSEGNALLVDLFVHQFLDDHTSSIKQAHCFKAHTCQWASCEMEK
jgi:hypothetical protein